MKHNELINKRKKIAKAREKIIENIEQTGIIENIKKYSKHNRESWKEYQKNEYLQGASWPDNSYLIVEKLLRSKLIKKYPAEIISCAIAMYSEKMAEAGVVVFGGIPSSNSEQRAKEEFLEELCYEKRDAEIDTKRLMVQEAYKKIKELNIYKNT